MLRYLDGKTAVLVIIGIAAIVGSKDIPLFILKIRFRIALAWI